MRRAWHGAGSSFRRLDHCLKSCRGPYREQHPAAVEPNHQQLHVRDQKHHPCHLANNNSAFDLKSIPQQGLRLLGTGLRNLANNDVLVSRRLLPDNRG